MTTLPVERVIEEILQFRAQGARGLSVYMATDPSREAGRNLDAHLRDLTQPITEQLRSDPVARAQLERDIEQVNAFLDSLRPAPRSIAIFSCEARGFLRTVPLSERVRPHACWQEEFELRPLLAAVDEHERTMVLLVDKERARFFRVFLEQIEEVATLEDEIPRKHAQGGEMQRRLQRDHERHVLWHSQRVVDALTRLADRDVTDRILLGGTPEVLAEVHHLLPKRLRSRIHGNVRAPLFATVAEVMDAVREVQQRVERADEDQLVKMLIERVGSGHAVLGGAAVVDAVQDQRCYLLVTANEAKLAGYSCGHCDFVTIEGAAHCPVCEAVLRADEDVIDALARRTLRQGGKVEEVRGTAAVTLMPYGGVAALVRYAVARSPLAGAAS
jgi:peptide subunit release factor 1 (eRF1)